MEHTVAKTAMGTRFRGFLPVVVDVETGGFDSKKDALLEIAAVIITMNSTGHLEPSQTLHAHVQPFPGANMDQKALDFNGIDPYHPFRIAKTEDQALGEIFEVIRAEIKGHNCSRAILVGHNAPFDLSFVNAAAERSKHKKNPFHQFSTLDTVSLGALAYGQTVLAKMAKIAGLDWDNNSAHSAVYDAEQTAKLFCLIANKWRDMSLFYENAPGKRN
ncbi:MAG: ribonuclease T [Gammaproteobacteria bacterium]|nr:ribonuclease T [Gammaproteobacteria bacterium]MDH5692803.1 ribonuclease T [Gammaproteobacteria bacterium]